jgi:hypothetical protein
MLKKVISLQRYYKGFIVPTCSEVAARADVIRPDFNAKHNQDETCFSQGYCFCTSEGKILRPATSLEDETRIQHVKAMHTTDHVGDGMFTLPQSFLDSEGVKESFQGASRFTEAEFDILGYRAIELVNMLRNTDSDAQYFVICFQEDGDAPAQDHIVWLSLNADSISLYAPNYDDMCFPDCNIVDFNLNLCALFQLWQEKKGVTYSLMFAVAYL